MRSNTASVFENQTCRRKRLHAVIEVADGEIKIYPVSQSDTDTAAIYDALRFFVRKNENAGREPASSKEGSTMRLNDTT